MIWKHQQGKGQKVNTGAANITWHVQFWRVRGDHQRGRSKQGDWQLYEPSLFVGLADRFSTWKKVDKDIQAFKGLDKSRYIVRKRGFAIVSSGYRSPGFGVACHTFICHRVAMTLVYFNVHSCHKTVTGWLADMNWRYWHRYSSSYLVADSYTDSDQELDQWGIYNTRNGTKLLFTCPPFI